MIFGGSDLFLISFYSSYCRLLKLARTCLEVAEAAIKGKTCGHKKTA